jgi:hypothetical protein
MEEREGEGRTYPRREEVRPMVRGRTWCSRTRWSGGGWEEDARHRGKWQQRKGRDGREEKRKGKRKGEEERASEREERRRRD